MEAGLRMVQTRVCGAWMLPGDPTCAGVARRLFQRVASELALARDAMTELEKDLSARGFSGRLVRADDQAADMAVLSIASGLTVWCRSAVAWLRLPGVAAQRWSYWDLVELEEQAVQAYEMIIATTDPLFRVGATRGASLIMGARHPAATGRVP